MSIGKIGQKCRYTWTDSICLLKRTKISRVISQCWQCWFWRVIGNKIFCPRENAQCVIPFRRFCKAFHRHRWICLKPTQVQGFFCGGVKFQKNSRCCDAAQKGGRLRLPFFVIKSPSIRVSLNFSFFVFLFVRQSSALIWKKIFKFNLQTRKRNFAILTITEQLKNSTTWRWGC